MTKKKIIINDEGRTCTGCYTFKPWDEFHNKTKGKIGKTSACKDCDRSRKHGEMSEVEKKVCQRLDEAMRKMPRMEIEAA